MAELPIRLLGGAIVEELASLRCVRAESAQAVVTVTSAEVRLPFASASAPAVSIALGGEEGLSPARLLSLLEPLRAPAKFRWRDVIRARPEVRGDLVLRLRLNPAGSEKADTR